MSLTSAHSSESEEFLAPDSLPEQEMSARKRVALGLSPRRPTAKTMPARPMATFSPQPRDVCCPLCWLWLYWRLP
jgi:hypothetical protein